ncbi:MAG: amidohydrolase [Phycisphaerae bacterium]|jgi:amidohydrolase
MSGSWDDQLGRILPEITALRRHLHAHPELSFKEHATARLVRERLARLPNLRLLEPLIETDVVAVLNPERDGPCLGLRADMDALPILERRETPHQSTVPGVMHACGHDGHTACLVGAAMMLASVADRLPGKVKFIFQPAEEDGGGAGLLVERGVLDSPRVDAMIALHAWPNQPVGSIAIRSGPATAANNEFRIRVRGQGGHGAYPHRCVDPIVVACQIVTALQTLVSRNVNPFESAVVTVGQISGGTACNVIPPECLLVGTIRHYEPRTGEMLRTGVRRIAEQTALALGAAAEVEVRPGYPSLTNDPAVAALIEEVGRDLLGEGHVITTENPSMGAEDFAFYARRVPAAMFRLGVRPAGMDTYPGLHHPEFEFQDDALPTGIRMLCELAVRFIGRRTANARPA